MRFIRYLNRDKISFNFTAVHHYENSDDDDDDDVNNEW